MEGAGEVTMTTPDAGRRLIAVTDRLRTARRAGRAARSDLPSLLLFTDPARMAKPWEAARRLPHGAGVVYRAFGRADAVEVGLRLAEIARSRSLAFLVGRDVDLAERLGASGLHLPERDIPRAVEVRRHRPDWILTGAVHSVHAAITAHDLDAVVLSPIFTAGGASAGRPALGPQALKEAATQAAIPVFGLGGVSADNAEDLADSGAWGLAGIDGFVQAFAGD